LIQRYPEIFCAEKMRGPIARQSVANRKSYASIQDSPLAKFSGRVSDGAAW
jgi:hypothetical protein